MSDYLIEPNEEFLSRLDKVKNHVNTHWKKYAVSGALVLTAGVTFAVTKRYYAIHAATSEGMNINILPKAYFSNQHVTTILETARKGPPSYVIYDPATGEMWLSQNLFAKAVGESINNVSKYFNDPNITSIAGRTPERIAIAAVA